MYIVLNVAKQLMPERKLCVYIRAASHWKFVGPKITSYILLKNQ